MAQMLVKAARKRDRVCRCCWWTDKKIRKTAQRMAERRNWQREVENY